MKKLHNYLIFLVILFLGFTFQFKYINEFPSHIHAWAQADRYALSLGFVKNNLNFFNPQTYVLNRQFPFDWKVPSNVGTTAVDFPIHDYIPALIMKITGITSPWVFRLYILLYSFFGFFFLYKLSFLFTNSFYKSFFVLLFAATSPVFVYYQGGFLPTIPSLANAFIGIYFYCKYLKQSNIKDFYLSIAFLTLAALSRSTFVLSLLAIIGIEFLRLIKGESTIKDKVIPVSLSISTILSYFVYNHYLRSKYGSVFLNHLMIPSSFSEAKEMLNIAYDNWKFQYFSKFHYLLLLGLLVIAIYYVLRKKVRSVKIQNEFGLFISVTFVGCIIFSLLMLKQFPNHDYYFLDTYFLPIILFLIYVLTFIPKLDFKHSNIISIVFFLAAIFLVTNAISSQKNRRETGSWDVIGNTIDNFKYSDKLLDSLKINDNAKLLVINAYAPNIPFILMKRSGFAIMSSKKQAIEKALNWDYDYIVVQNNYFVSETYVAYPDILLKLDKIADNGKISICKLSKIENKQTLLGFIGIENKIPSFESIITFDTIADNHWQNTQITSSYRFSGKNAGFINNTMEYGITYKSSDIKELKVKPRLLLFSSYFLKDTLNSCQIVVSINSNGQNIYSQSYDLNEYLKKKNTWENVKLLFQLPKIESNNYEFGIYIWNNGHNNLYYDDFSFKIF